MAMGGQKESGYNLVNVGTLTLETADLNPRGIVVDREMLMITDWKTNQVHVYRRHDGKLLSTLQLEAIPYGICCVNDKEICIALWDGTIQIMSVDDTGVITSDTIFNLKTPFDQCYGVGKFMDKVVVSGVKQNTVCWCVVSRDGHVDKIHNICEGSYMSYLTTTKTNMVYISCFDSLCVYGYNILNPRQKPFTYKHEGLGYPRGITVDDYGYLFVCDIDYGSIYHLTHQCQLVTKYRIPWNPIAIFWDHGIIYVASWMNNKITLWKPEYPHQQGYHKAPEVFVRDERKQHIFQETSTWIKWGIVDKGESSLETDVPPSVQVEDSTDDKQDLQDEEEFLKAIRNNYMKVEQMIRNQKIPKQSIIKVALKQNGYSEGVQLALREMSTLLRRKISHAVGVWCGYRPEDPETPVFVVTLKNQKCILKKDEIPEPFIDYKIITRHKYVPNDEERIIVEHYGSKSFRSEDVARVNSCITIHTESLMREHSNLSIIGPCSIKACGYMRKEMKVIEDTCIVFYVPVKGIIPAGEKEFPRVIDGIGTDVREGEFLFFGAHNAMEYHPKLRIGCCITGDKIGSLGGFVDLPGEKVGCLTAAHVVLKSDEIQRYIDMNDEEKKKLNDDLAQGKEQIKIHQPTPQQDLEPFGRVHAIVLDEGNIFAPSVDAAIIEITDGERKPEMGNFPDGDFENVGFTREDPMLYNSGDILDDIEPLERGSLVIKYGCTTGITRGYMEWIGNSVRALDQWGNYCFPVMRGQFEIKVLNFAEPGDSGALVFLCRGGNIRNLHAVGMIVGGSSTGCSCFITPIKEIFNKFELRNGFKAFPPRQLSHQETTSLQPIEHISAQEHGPSARSQILENINSIEQNTSAASPEQAISDTSRRVDSLENRLDSLEQDMKEGFGRVDSKLENMNQSFNRITELLQNLQR